MKEVKSLERIQSPATPKAIPTLWNGWFFRSRTEARWAVFFAKLGIKFEFEIEGFQFPDGTRYLPDFYLPQPKMFGEVKPTFLEPNEENKVRLLAGGIAARVLFLIGIPDFKSYYCASVEDDLYTITDYSLDIYMWPKLWAERPNGRLFSSPGYDGNSEEQFSKQYREAVYAARSARFEGIDSL